MAEQRVEERKIEEQRIEAIQRLRSLFDRHNIPFGAPEHLGTLLLSLHEQRHFTMDFWSLVNAFSDSGSGAMNEKETLEAVVESIAGVGVGALPADELSGAEELRQLLAGVDVSRPAEPPRPFSQPVEDLPEQLEKSSLTREPHNTISDESLLKRRAIGEALAKLEQSTRELRAQLAAIDAQLAADSMTPKASPDEVAQPAVNTIGSHGAQQNQSPSKWDRMSSFAENEEQKRLEDRQPSSARHLHQPVSASLSQTASPLAEAVPPRLVAVFAEPPEDLPSEARPSTDAPPLPSSAVLPVVPAKAQPSSVMPGPVVGTSKLPEPAAVFEPRPPATLGHRGLAIPDADDDPSIKVPFSEYAAEHERSPLARLFTLAVIVVLLIAGAYAGATHTAAGRAWWLSAAQSIRKNIPSSMVQQDSDSRAPAQPQPVTPAVTEEPPAPTSAVPKAGSPAAPAAAQQSFAPAPVANAKQSADPAEGASRQRENPPVVDESVLRVPASTMAANLVTSRVPAYPEVARAQGIEGSVALEVIVSQTGMVKYARAIDGDKQLRAAAEDAVLRWHYKPYMLNGEPVEVRTAVKVDFRLPQ